MFDPRIVFDYVLSFLGLFIGSFMILLFVQNLHRIKVDPSPLVKLPCLSVIIPAHNEEDTISKTLNSVAQSDYPKNRMEVIVVDDGSTDATLEIMKRYAVKYSFIKIIAKKQGGKSSALNVGIKVARGQLIATLDSDSYIKPNAFRLMTGFFRDANVAAVTSVMKVANPKGFWQEMQRVEYLLTVFGRRLLSFINSINVTPGPLSMFRREVFERVGGYDEGNILEDQEMAMRIQAHNYRIESSMNAVVWTSPPDNFRQLLHQRVRWHRGGVRNILKHYYLVSRRYGDFGLVVMPLAIFSVVATFAVLLAVGTRLLESGSAYTHFILYGLQGIWFTISPLHILGGLVLAASLLWAYMGISQHEGEKVGWFSIVAYTVIYAPLITLFWLFTAYKELKGEKLSW